MGQEAGEADINELLLSVASGDTSNVEDVISSLEEPSARVSLAAEVGPDGKVFGECSSNEGYKSMVSVLASALVMEAKWESAEHVDSLASALCHLVAQHDLGNDGAEGEMTKEAEGEVSRLLGSSRDAVDTVAEAFLSVARQVVGDHNKGWYAPALVLADACLVVEPSSELRRDLVDLLGRRIFSNTTSATAKEVALCSSLIQDLSKEEFDGSIIRPLKFNLASSPGATMGTLAAFIEQLYLADKGAFLRSYLAGTGNIVPAALKQLTADNTAHSTEASAVMVSVVRACPNEGAQVVSKALASAIQQEPSAPLYDCIEEVGTTMLGKKGTPDAAKYGSLADNDVVPVLEKGNEEEATAALSVWTELQESTSSPPAAAAPGAQAVSKVDERIAAKTANGAASAAVGAQAVSKADAARLDERIAAKSGSAQQPTATAVVNNAEEDKSRTDRENAKAAAFAVAGGAGVAAAAVAATNGSDGHDTKPGVQQVSENARIKQQARGGAAPATTPGVQSVQKQEVDDLDARIQRKTNVQPKQGDDGIADSKKTIVVASHQIAGSEHAEDIKVKEDEAGAPVVTEEGEYGARGKGHESFQDEPGNSVVRQPTDNAAPIDNVDRGITNEPDIEYGDGGMDDGPGLVEAVQVDPDEEEEFIPAAVEFDPDSKKPPIYKDPKIRNYGIAVLCVVVALAVGLSVGLTKSLNKDEKEVQKTEAPSAQPTAAPTTFRDKGQVAAFVADILDQEDIPDTPQSKALEFILNQDEQRLEINDATTEQDEARLIQRTVLAAFAYATNSAEWHYCGEPTDETGKCTYDNISRQQGGQFVEEEASTWLSHHHECSWFGIQCDSDFVVKNIDLTNNNLNGPFLEDLTQLTEIQKLNFPANKLTGKLPDSIENMKGLRELRITSNDMSGQIPDGVYELALLENLVLGFNDFSGQISTKIGQLTSLKGFHAFNSRMDGPIPTEIGELSFLTELRIHDSAFTGPLPTEIGKLTTLTQLWNQRTLMTGTIPDTVGNMVDLELFYINESRYSGALPASFYKLSKLKEFLAWDIKTNNEPATPGIGGTISPDIKDMTELVLFIARGNGFEKELPDAFGDLPKLSTVWLNFNDVTGVSPFCDKALPNIQRRPYGGLDMDCLEWTDDGGNIVPPKVSCPCCTVCCDPNGVCRNMAQQ